MKLSFLKQTIHITLYGVVIVSTIIIIKSNIRSFQFLYSVEKSNITSTNAFINIIF
ncbi:MAG: hypothetical protein V4565_10730 [Bacteroidota bacterium]